jgi:holliday junction DNA helicase RuvA
MYEYIRGKVQKSMPAYVVVEAFGIGYKISMAAKALAHVSDIGSDVIVYVSLVIREHEHTIFGFLSQQERDFFEVITNVSGIGPKTGLAMLGKMSMKEIVQSIQRKDRMALCKAPGIGKKTAERVILEMQDKLLEFVVCSDDTEEKFRGNDVVYDAINALINLGYTHMAAERAINAVMDGDDAPHELPKLITAALQHI